MNCVKDLCVLKIVSLKFVCNMLARCKNLVKFADEIETI